ncbi:hypothetical protein OLMES_2328 [Oleiphilus messinensis]|uniref:Uncharacterized protein n=1 Tax=Oleiphilus messinensis TaxID=141451 RepID=A0A1Y0I7G9_9GAMM|nr:hypothetical protein [Oleiphilus messinensis]ARU56391.1 hypothetical protein OLMES_2328 [Oleiphilus messinensis]
MRPPAVCPYGEQITEDSSIVKEIELGFYMRLIMNSDKLKKRTSKATSIDVSPSDPKYPKTIGMGRGLLQAVSFDRLEQPVVDRINELHKDVTQKKELFIDSKWLGERMDKATLIRAENVLIDLGKKSDKYRTQGTPLIVDPKVQSLQ